MGEFLFLLCACVSILAAPSLLLAVVADMMRGRSPRRLMLALLLSAAAVATSWGFLYLRIKGYDFRA